MKMRGTAKILKKLHKEKSVSYIFEDEYRHLPTKATEQAALLSPAVAVITTLPAETAVSNPFGSTVTTAVLPDKKLTVLSTSAPASTVASAPGCMIY